MPVTPSYSEHACLYWLPMGALLSTPDPQPARPAPRAARAVAAASVLANHVRFVIPLLLCFPLASSFAATGIVHGAAM